ncbi:enoyl-CoA hydratase-related protein [Azospirillum halopraeferens]|uniref:enoyl-CoA hydratase-related protein n=1 Tax=Azospirillum halopraeferens TaxID=34010 RepID=UPI000405776C|nr:enoyl-CoA hydratase-related protein [Azospirillum halopraeferens]
MSPAVPRSDDAPVIVRPVGEGVVQVTLNRPEALNALSPALIDALAAALARLDADAAVRVLLLAGAGRHFCAGADVRALAAMPAEQAVRTGFAGCCEALAAVTKPVVAAVHGHCLGGGCELVEMCDVVIAADTAVFGHPEVRLGTMPGAGGTQRLPRAVGRARALDLLLTGRLMDAAEAERAGLVSRVVPAERLLPEALAAAAGIAALSAPVAAMIKAAVRAADDMPLAAGLAVERGLFHRTLTLDDAREGMAAFLEKRPPVFTGR